MRAVAPPAPAGLGAGCFACFAGGDFVSDVFSDFVSDLVAGFVCLAGGVCCAATAVSRPTAATSASGIERYTRILVIGPPASPNAPEVIEITGEIGNVKAPRPAMRSFSRR